MATKVRDDRGRELLFSGPPRRVVSLVPSDTLTVSALGAGTTLVGRTDYCVLPENVVSEIPSVGGTKNPRLKEILALEPDLVLANQEENSRHDLEALLREGIRVYIAFPKTVAAGIAHLAKLASLLGVERTPPARALCKRAYEALREAERTRRSPPLRAFCPIWMDPLMTIHGDTYISNMMSTVGLTNVFADRERRYPLAADLGRRAPLSEEKVGGRDVRYPRITPEEVLARDPELVLLPDEPHAFTEADVATLEGFGLARDRVLFVDGKDLCWYGARAAEGIERLRHAISDHLGDRDRRP